MKLIKKYNLFLESISEKDDMNDILKFFNDTLKKQLDLDRILDDFLNLLEMSNNFTVALYLASSHRSIILFSISDLKKLNLFRDFKLEIDSSFFKEHMEYFAFGNTDCHYEFKVSIHDGGKIPIYYVNTTKETLEIDGYFSNLRNNDNSFYFSIKTEEFRYPIFNTMEFLTSGQRIKLNKIFSKINPEERLDLVNLIKDVRNMNIAENYKYLLESTKTIADINNDILSFANKELKRFNLSQVFDDCLNLLENNIFNLKFLVQGTQSESISILSVISNISKVFDEKEFVLGNRECGILKISIDRSKFLFYKVKIQIKKEKLSNKDLDIAIDTLKIDGYDVKITSVDNVKDKFIVLSITKDKFEHNFLKKFKFESEEEENKFNSLISSLSFNEKYELIEIINNIKQSSS